MVIRYACRHCLTEIGILPFESVKDTILQLQKADEEQDEQFLLYEKDGDLTVRCICEQCQQSLQHFPNYYSLHKWLQ